MSAGQTRGTRVKAGRPLMRLLWWPKRKLREGVPRENREKWMHLGHVLEIHSTRLFFMDWF